MLLQAKLRSGGSKLGKSEAGRVLLREDDVQQLEFNSAGQVSRSKPRRLLLLNDQLVCAAVSGRASEAGEAATISLAGEVDLVQGNLAMLTENLAQDMADLMQDFDTMSR